MIPQRNISLLSNRLAAGGGCAFGKLFSKGIIASPGFCAASLNPT